MDDAKREQDTEDGAPLDGRHALVTGAGRGIGAAIATALAGRGADVTLIGRNLERLSAQAGTIAAATGRRTLALSADVTEEPGLAKAFAEASAAFGPPAILVNNAGIAASAPFARTDRALWQETIETNLTGAFNASRLAYPEMVRAGWGRIVNIASTAGLKGYAYVAAYCASKHGVVGLTRALAIEAARTGVTVNAVCPGFTDTDIVAEAVRNIVARTGRGEDEARAELAAMNPQGRLIRPDEVAEVVAWLCLPASAAITGQAIAVAGGEVM